MGVLVHGGGSAFVVAAGYMVCIQDVEVRRVCEGRGVPGLEAECALDVWLPFKQIESQERASFLRFAQRGDEGRDAGCAQIIKGQAQDRSTGGFIHVQSKLRAEYECPHFAGVWFEHILGTSLERMHGVAIALIGRTDIAFHQGGCMAPEPELRCRRIACFEHVRWKHAFPNGMCLGGGRQSGVDTHKALVRFMHTSAASVCLGNEIRRRGRAGRVMHQD